MKNSEIRGRALSKVKSQINGLSAIVVVVYVIQKLLGLMSGITGTALDVALGVVVHIITALLTAGLARVAIRAWREGKAGWGDMLICFRDRRYLLAGLYGGIIAAVFGVLGDAVYIFGNATAGFAAGALFDWAAAACIGYIVYAADLFENIPVLEAARKGMAALTKGIARVVCMEINLYWWIALAMAVMFAFVGIVGGVSGIPLRLVLFITMCVLKWVVGGYIMLCEAGLARTLLKG